MGLRGISVQAPQFLNPLLPAMGQIKYKGCPMDLIHVGAHKNLTVEVMKN
jgi:hypothetical protein